jgi:pyridoxamine 5'-phosphate oxidase
MVLLKNIDHDAFVFFTNFNSKKATEILGCGKASFVWHSKFLRRQIRVRGFTSLESDQASDEYYNSRSLRSRLGAWASLQSTPLASREVLLDRVEKFSERFGEKPTRPEFWGGFRIVPAEIEFWAEGESRLHDRFLWVKGDKASNWNVERLYP